VVNNPAKDVLVYKYYVDGEKKARWWGLQRFVYYLLVVGGILSFWAFRW
jgi:hypothetical protein